MDENIPQTENQSVESPTPRPGRNKDKLVLTFLFFLLFLFIVGNPFHKKIVPEEGKGIVAAIQNPFRQIEVEAKAVYVYDVNTGTVLFSKNAEAQLPIASLTKLMTALVAAEEAPDYTAVQITPASLIEEGDSGLVLGERWRLRDLIRFMLLVSSNDGASAVASVIGARDVDGTETTEDDTTMERSSFIQKMNAKSKELKLDQTYFLNETGLDRGESSPGSVGSAKDMAILFSYILKNEPALIELTKNDTAEMVSLDDKKHLVKNTNPVVNDIPGLLASKTGFTDLAGGNLVIAFDAGFAKPVVIAILGSSEKGRFTDAQKLVWTSLQYFHTLP